MKLSIWEITFSLLTCIKKKKIYILSLEFIFFSSLREHKRYLRSLGDLKFEIPWRFVIKKSYNAMNAGDLSASRPNEDDSPEARWSKVENCNWQLAIGPTENWNWNLVLKIGNWYGMTHRQKTARRRRLFRRLPIVAAPSKLKNPDIFLRKKMH